MEKGLVTYNTECQTTRLARSLSNFWVQNEREAFNLNKLFNLVRGHTIQYGPCTFKTGPLNIAKFTNHGTCIN